MRLEVLEDICTILDTEEKTILLVRHCLEQKYYIKKIIKECREPAIYQQLFKHPHPHIPHLYEVIPTGTICILIEEFVNGKTLEYVLSEKRLLDQEIRSYMEQLLSAIEHLHSMYPPIIHRDIKPGNIMILEDGTLKLFDFEIARSFKNKKDRDTQILGSAGYASPEQYGFHQSDCRSDIYALGVVLKAMIQKDIEAPCIQSPYRQIIETCMQLDPEKRYQSIQEMQQALGICKAKKRRVSLFSYIPGLSDENIIHRFLYLLYYVFCIYIGVVTEFENVSGPIELICERIAFGLSMAIIPALIRNLDRVMAILPSRLGKYKGSKLVIGIGLWFASAFVFMSVFVLLSVFLEALL